MNGDVYTSKTKDLKINYIMQLVLYGIIIIFNIVLIFKIIWLKNLLYFFYLSLTIFGIFYFLIPIIPLVLIQLNKLNQKLIKRFKLMSMIFCILSFITGLLFFFVLMINSLESSVFCRDCPFNLPNSYINKMYNNYVNNNINKKKLKEQCTNRRCLFNNKISDDYNLYEYICNYNPTKEFETIKSINSSNITINQIECSKINNNDIINFKFNEKEIYKFFEMCDFLDEIFICQRTNEPKEYFIKEDFECPKSNYFTILIIFCMLNALLNLILSFLSWRAAYIKYKDIIKLLRNIHNNDHNRNGSNSLNSTQNTSKIQNENKEESFKKDQTEIIVAYTETEENMINNNNSFNKKEYKNKHIINIINNNINNEIKINNNLQFKNVINEDYFMDDDDESKKEDIKDNNSNKVYINENLKNKDEKGKFHQFKNKIIILNNIKASSSERKIMEENQKIPKI